MSDHAVNVRMPEQQAAIGALEREWHDLDKWLRSLADRDLDERPKLAEFHVSNVPARSISGPRFVRSISPAGDGEDPTTLNTSLGSR